MIMMKEIMRMKKKKKKVKVPKGISTATRVKVRKKWPDGDMGFLLNETKAITVPCPKCGSRNVAICFDPICGPSSGECLDCGYCNGIFTFASDALDCWNGWLYSLLGPVFSHDHPKVMEDLKAVREMRE